MEFCLKQLRRSTNQCKKNKNVHLWGIIPKNFKLWLSITFNDKLQYKKFKNGVEFVFCPNSSQFDEEDWSNDWKDYTNNEKLEDAAQIRRKEIMSLRSVFSSWPPLEKEMKEW